MLLQMVDGDFFVGHRLATVTVLEADFNPATNQFTVRYEITPFGDEPTEHTTVLKGDNLNRSELKLIETLLSWQFIPWVTVHVVYHEDPKLVPDQQPTGWVCHRISTGNFVGLVRV